MTTTARGVTIQLDVERKLRFDGVALLRLEDITGMTVLQICRKFSDENATVDADGNLVAPELDSDGNMSPEDQKKAEERAANLSIKVVCQIAQAGLTGELPKATTDDIVTLMDEHGEGNGTVGRIMSYAIPTFKALTLSIGDDSKNENADPAKKKKKSGRPPVAHQPMSVGAGTPTND